MHISNEKVAHYWYFYDFIEHKSEWNFVIICTVPVLSLFAVSGSFCPRQIELLWTEDSLWAKSIKVCVRTSTLSNFCDSITTRIFLDQRNQPFLILHEPRFGWSLCCVALGVLPSVPHNKLIIWVRPLITRTVLKLLQCSFLDSRPVKQRNRDLRETLY